jgi:ankyrin repeat protein
MPPNCVLLCSFFCDSQLHCAAHQGHIAACTALVRGGAILNLPTNKNETASMLAESAGHSACSAVLLSASFPLSQPFSSPEGDPARLFSRHDISRRHSGASPSHWTGGLSYHSPGSEAHTHNDKSLCVCVCVCVCVYAALCHDLVLTLLWPLYTCVFNFHGHRLLATCSGAFATGFFQQLTLGH